MKTKLLLVLILANYFSFGQNLSDIIKNYNASIDPNDKLDSITHLSVDMYQKIKSTMQEVIFADTTTSFYSIFGKNSFSNKSEGKNIDINQMINTSSWETKNIIKTNINFLICDDDEIFELTKVTDSVFVLKKITPDREIYYELDRESYDLKRKITDYQGEKMITRFFEYRYIDGIKVTTKFSFENEVATAEVVKFNYKFWKALDEVED